MALQHREEILDQWKSNQTLAEKMIPLLGSLYRDKGVAVKVCHGADGLGARAR